MRRFIGLDADASEAPIADLAFSRDGDMLAASFRDTVILADSKDGHLIKRMDDVQGVASIDFAPDGRRLAAACHDGRIRIYDVIYGRELAKTDASSGGYETVAWSPDGNMIAAGCFEPRVSIFDGKSYEELSALDPDVFDDEGRTCVLFSKKGMLITTAYNHIIFWSPSANTKRFTAVERLSVRGHAHVIDLALSPDESSIAGLAESEGTSTVHLWRRDRREKSGIIKLLNFSRRISWSPDCSFIAVAEHSGVGVSMWDPASLKRIDRSLEESQKYDVTALAIHPDGTVLAAGTEGGKVIAWDPHTGTII